MEYAGVMEQSVFEAVFAGWCVAASVNIVGKTWILLQNVDCVK